MAKTYLQIATPTTLLIGVARGRVLVSPNGQRVHPFNKTNSTRAFTTPECCDELLCRFAALETERDRLREALEPLANLDLSAGQFDRRPDDQIVYERNNSRITCGDVRRAIRMLQPDEDQLYREDCHSSVPNQGAVDD